MQIPVSIFRAYDIRGIALIKDEGQSQKIEVTEELAHLVGAAYVQFLTKEIGRAPRIVVGRDDRLTGEVLAKAFIDGALALGAEVTDISYAISPYLYFAVCQGGFDGGVNITASHNTGDYNGFKLTRAGSAPIAGEEIQEILKIVEEMNRADGGGERVEVGARRGAPIQGDFLNEYFQKLTELAPLKRKLKVIIDCGNGTAGRFAPEFFRQLGCEVVELYCEPDGNFPNHLPNPEETETLHDLQQKVLAEKADLGIAYDGDGDRAGIVDEKGQIIASDRLLIILARDLLARNPGATVIFDVKCSNILADEIRKAGGVPLCWKTGHSFIKRKLKETGALLAGEVSGHMFFGENYFGVDDGLLASAKVASILASDTKPLSSYFADLPTSFTTPELKLGVPDNVKFVVMEKLIAEFSQDFVVDTLDGVRFTLSDGSHSTSSGQAWGLIRASNTSPYLTCRCEGASKEQLQKIVAELKKRLEKHPEVDISKL